MSDIGAALLAFWGAIGLDAGLLARYGPRVLGGLWITLQLVAISVSIGFILAVPLAILRCDGPAPARNAVLAFSIFFRGTPLLAQIYLVYYGAGQFHDALDSIGLWPYLREAWFCALATFTLNTAAYQCEILRGGLQSVPRGQREAARAMGLGRLPLYARVLLPQALIISLRPLGNELVLMIKASSVAALITVFDIMGETRLAYSRTYDFQVYLWAALVYLVLVEGVRIAWQVFERRLTRHLALRRS